MHSYQRKKKTLRALTICQNWPASLVFIILLPMPSRKLQCYSRTIDSATGLLRPQRAARRDIPRRLPHDGGVLEILGDVSLLG